MLQVQIKASAKGPQSGRTRPIERSRVGRSSSRADLWLKKTSYHVTYLTRTRPANPLCSQSSGFGKSGWQGKKMNLLTLFAFAGVYGLLAAAAIGVYRLGDHRQARTTTQTRHRTP